MFIYSVFGMKIFFCLVLFGACASCGLLYKRRLKNECELYEYLLDFERYFSSNLTLFKNNVVEIINNYKNIYKNKNRKFDDFFVKNGSIFEFNEKILQKYISNKNNVSIISVYLSGLGKNEYDYEKEKSEKFKEFVLSASESSAKCLNEKGSLYVKLSLAIGAVLCILIW